MPVLRHRDIRSGKSSRGHGDQRYSIRTNLLYMRPTAGTLSHLPGRATNRHLHGLRAASRLTKGSARILESSETALVEKRITRFPFILPITRSRTGRPGLEPRNAPHPRSVRRRNTDAGHRSVVASQCPVRASDTQLPRRQPQILNDDPRRGLLIREPTQLVFPLPTISWSAYQSIHNAN